MENIVNRIKKDTVIIACKKRAKEILKNSQKVNAQNPLTLMNCLEIAAKEMRYSSWYELRTNVKNQVKKEDISDIEKWEEFIFTFFLENYDAIHFEVRNEKLEIRVRKYGLIDNIEHDLSINYIKDITKKFNLKPNEYDWISKQYYNIQTIPVYKNKEEELHYDMVVIKKDNFEVSYLEGKLKIAGVIGSGMKTTLKDVFSNNEITFTNSLLNIGFNKINIDYINNNFWEKNYFIAGLTGSGKSNTAEIIIKELRKKYQVVEVKEDILDEQQQKNFILAQKTDPDYIYFPELRNESTCQMIKKAIKNGYKIITTIHANSIDNVYQKTKQWDIELFDENLTNIDACIIYQKLEAILCPMCKEKDFSLKKIVKDVGFMNYINKYEKHNEAENSIYKKNTEGICKSKDCYKGLIGRKVIAEVFNIKKRTSVNVNENLERLKNGKIGDYLRLRAMDFNSYKYENILKGEMEL